MPAKKPAKRKPAASRPSIKTEAVKPAAMPAPAKGESCATGTCGCATGGTCAGCDGRCPCKTWLGCHFLGVLKQKRGIVGWVGMFWLMGVVQYYIHHVILADAYRASAALWLPQAAMRLDWMLAANAGIALAVVIVFNLAQKFKTYWEGARLGLLITMPYTLAGVYAAAAQPIPATITTWWVAEGAILGIAGGLMLTGLGRHRFLQGKWCGGCGKGKK